MRTESQYLMQTFPVRKTRAQKGEFRDWLVKTLEDAGYQPELEEKGSVLHSCNVVVGSPERAKIIFTAHYDTPARLPFPNFNAPRNPLLTLAGQIPLLLLFCGAAIVLEVLTLCLTDSPLCGLLTGYGCLLAACYLMLAGPANPSNVNDNTSGTLTLLEIALAMPEELREQAAFVFFDNEEKGLIGSSRFKKAHGKKLDQTMLINFDCVSDGDSIQFYPNKKLKKRPDLLDFLEQSFLPAEGKEVQIVRGFGIYPSDQRQFPLGVGVAALNHKWFGYYLRKIHTKRDTVFQEENIELLCQGVSRLMARYKEQSELPV